MKLTRYWFELNEPPEPHFSHFFGVTAWTYADALAILQSTAGVNLALLKVLKSIENIDIRTIDPNHAKPNMGTCSVRGIWFPQGYQ